MDLSKLEMLRAIPSELHVVTDRDRSARAAGQVYAGGLVRRGISGLIEAYVGNDPQVCLRHGSEALLAYNGHVWHDVLPMAQGIFDNDARPRDHRQFAIGVYLGLLALCVALDTINDDLDQLVPACRFVPAAEWVTQTRALADTMAEGSDRLYGPLIKAPFDTPAEFEAVQKEADDGNA